MASCNLLHSIAALWHFSLKASSNCHTCVASLQVSCVQTHAQHSIVFHSSLTLRAMQLRVAGVQLLYNSDVVGAALSFLNELLHHRSRVMKKDGSMTEEPGQPRNLTERVLHSFARYDISVDRPVSLPLVSVDMYCPGEDSMLCLTQDACTMLAVHISIRYSPMQCRYARLPSSLPCTWCQSKDCFA